MNTKEKNSGILKTVIGFLNRDSIATRRRLRPLDVADVFIAIAPLLFFGCLLFGIRALLVSAICIVAFVAGDYVWDILVKKTKRGIKDISLSSVFSGVVLAMSLSSSLNIWLVVAISVFAAFLMKTLFKEKTMYVAAPALVARGIFSLVFFRAFSVYGIPFAGTTAQIAPLDTMLNSTPVTFSAKFLFFGLHNGNIGETSVFLIAVGGIYLMLRRIINPIIPVSFITTCAILSLCFGENIAISLLGGGLFFAATYMALSYSFKTTPLYKKVLFGVCCGILTFVLRKLLKTEAAYLSVLITEAAFRLVTVNNIKSGLRFAKKPDFKKLLKKGKAIFWV